MTRPNKTVTQCLWLASCVHPLCSSCQFALAHDLAPWSRSQQREGTAGKPLLLAEPSVCVSSSHAATCGLSGVWAGNGAFLILLMDNHGSQGVWMLCLPYVLSNCCILLGEL